jgi:breast cancer 2 susceptibility protein
MFQTGSGKSVLISESSVQKARAVLEEEGNIKKGITAYQIFVRLFH